jgi:hypothetical protein
MRKKTILNLSIPIPCHENWENMTPNKRGRQCASCNKTVVDFSQYSDKQLVEFFTKVKDNICGRISTFQLQRQLVYTEPTKHSFINKLLLGTALTAGLTTTVDAQQNNTAQPAKNINAKLKHAAKKVDKIQAIPAQELKEIPMISEEQELKTAPSNEPVDMISYMVGGICQIDVGVTLDFPTDEMTQQTLSQINQGGYNEMSLKPHSAAAPKSRDGGGGL